MFGDNPALGHKFVLSADGIKLSPIKIAASNLEAKCKTVETSNLSVIVTDQQESAEFPVTFDSDNKVDLEIMRAWKLTRARRNATMQILDNDGVTPVLVYQLQNMAVSNEKPTADLETKNPEAVNIEFGCHAKVFRLP